MSSPGSGLPLPVVSAAMRDVMSAAALWATRPDTILITGETGIGKTTLAHRIHEMSARASRPFITVECGAIAESLIESELFGHVKGAFTGATEGRAGAFVSARKGTLLLDEVQNLSPAAQTRLLHVLDTKTIRPVGAHLHHPVDVRIIATTNQDLGTLVADRMFRSDLYFRLNHVTIDIPPLRERTGDLRAILTQWVPLLCQELDLPVKTIQEDTWDLVLAHPWPGNLREVYHWLRRSLLESANGQVSATHLAVLYTPSSPSSPGIVPSNALSIEPYPAFRTRTDRQYCQDVLARAHGNRRVASQMAGLPRATFYRLVSHLGID